MTFNVSSLTSGGIFTLKDYNSTLFDCLFINSYAGFGGAAIYLTENGNLSLKNVSIYNSKSKLGGALYISSSNYLELVNV